MRSILRDLVATNKSKYKLGTYYTRGVTEDNYIALPKMSGKGFSHLKIEGNEADGVALNDSGLEIRICKKNLIDVDKLAELIISYKGSFAGGIVEVDGRRCIKFYNSATHNKNLTACCPLFKEKTRYIFSFEARPASVVPDDYEYSGNLQFGFKMATGSLNHRPALGKGATDFKRAYAINNAGTTIKDISLSYGSVWYWLIDLDTVYLYEYEENENPEYEAPRVEYATLPTTVTLDGEETPVRLALGESLVLDNGIVKYITSDREYDLTATDFGKALLNIKGAYGEDFTFMVKAPLKPSGMTVGYYSTEHSDTATLKVKYLCGDKEILEPKEYLTRLNGAFTVIAPSIDSYVPIKRQINGVANGYTEIKIEYRGK